MQFTFFIKKTTINFSLIIFACYIEYKYDYIFKKKLIINTILFIVVLITRNNVMLKSIKSIFFYNQIQSITQFNII